MLFAFLWHFKPEYAAFTFVTLDTNPSVVLFLPQVAQYIDSSSLVFLDKEIFTDVTAGDAHEADLLVKAKN